MYSRPVFMRTVFDATELEASFKSLESISLNYQDQIEVGCMHQYLAVLKYHDRVHFPLDMLKHHQGHGPDFTVCNGHYFGVEITKVTTAEHQVWLKSARNYVPISSMQAFLNDAPEQRVAKLAMERIIKKNYKIPLYRAAQPDMEYVDLLLEEQGNCALDATMLMTLLRDNVCRLKHQKFKTISLISGSKLYYAFNTEDAEVLNAPDMIPRAKRQDDLEEAFSSISSPSHHHLGHSGQRSLSFSPSSSRPSVRLLIDA